MLYKLNTDQFISLRDISVVSIKPGIDNYYVSIRTTNGIDYYGTNHPTEQEARVEVLKLQKLMEDYLLWNKKNYIKY